MVRSGFKVGYYIQNGMKITSLNTGWILMHNILKYNEEKLHYSFIRLYRLYII